MNRVKHLFDFYSIHNVKWLYQLFIFHIQQVLTRIHQKAEKSQTSEKREFMFTAYATYDPTMT